MTKVRASIQLVRSDPVEEADEAMETLFLRTIPSCYHAICWGKLISWETTSKFRVSVYDTEHSDLECIRTLQTVVVVLADQMLHNLLAASR